MFEAELIVICIACAWIAYELFGRQIMDWSYYLRILSGVCIFAYLYWQAKENPSGFKESLEFAKQIMTSDRSPSPSQKRNVTNLMKKTVAANQKWQCGHCSDMLDSAYEVDHIVALYKGGTNEIANLVALCRNCHGKKTMAERLEDSSKFTAKL